MNPAFSKRSVDNTLSFKEKLRIDRQKMHKRHLDREYLKPENMEKNSIEFHRSNRLDLYPKIEKLLFA